MKWLIVVVIILCASPVWADGTPECDAFLAVNDSLFSTSGSKATAYVPADLPPQVWSIMRTYIENPEINRAAGGNIPDHINGFYVDLNADGTKEYVFEVQRFWGTAGRFYVLLADIGGEWNEVSTHQGMIHLSASSDNVPVITFISRGGPEDFLKQEYLLQKGRLDLLRSRRFDHGDISEDIVEKTETNRVMRSGAGPHPYKVSGPLNRDITK